jgi:hypothetical protein
MDDKSAIPLYEGDIHVDEGAWVIACTNALGKLSSSGDGSGVGEVFVGNGGALVAGGTDRKISNIGKKISIAGDGVDGEGALVLTSTAGDFEKNVFGTNIVLTDDATMGILPKERNANGLHPIPPTSAGVFFYTKSANNGLSHEGHALCRLPDKWLFVGLAHAP